jgi:hypothetical protein
MSAPEDIDEAVPFAPSLDALEGAARQQSVPIREETTLAIADLHRNPRNVRKHPEAQIRKLQQSIRRFGQTRPILVRRANLMVIAGHGVMEAMRRMGLTHIKAILWDVPQDVADQYMVADNRLAQLGRDDEEMLAEILREVESLELESIGFTADEAAKLLEQKGGKEFDISEVETGPVEDIFMVTVTGPLVHQAYALQVLRDLVEKYPEIELQIGTVERQL